MKRISSGFGGGVRKFEAIKEVNVHTGMSCGAFRITVTIYCRSNLNLLSLEMGQHEQQHLHLGVHQQMDGMSFVRPLVQDIFIQHVCQ